MAALTLEEAYRQARAHFEAGRIADAEQLCTAILRKVPNTHDTLLILGAIRVRQGRHHDALKAFDRACKALPSSADAWSNRGSALRSLGRLAEAVASYDRAIKLNPGAVAAHYNRGNVLRVLGRQDEALTSFDRAIALAPGDALAHYNAGLTLLESGDYRRGFSEFEWRWKALNATPRNEPLWRGDDISGKTILLHAEQGLGDALQFVRFVPMVAARGATVILEVRSPLKTLLANTPGATVLARGEPLPPFDIQCPLMSLPLALGLDLGGVGMAGPYIQADPQLIAQWRDRLPKDRTKIGLVWSGNASYQHDDERSMPLRHFEPLLSRSELALISLQTELRPDDAEFMRRDGRLIEHAADFANTAAIIENLDLIVSVNTSIAHLAAAMMKPMWILLSRTISDWRWRNDRDDTPWYPTVRLFRQTKQNDWASVVAAVSVALESWH